MRIYLIVALMFIIGCATYPDNKRRYSLRNLFRKDVAIEAYRTDNNSIYVIGYGTDFTMELAPNGHFKGTTQSEKSGILEKGFTLIKALGSRAAEGFTYREGETDGDDIDINVGQPSE